MPKNEKVSENTAYDTRPDPHDLESGSTFEDSDDYDEILQEYLDYGREVEAEPKAILYKYLDPDHGSAKTQQGYFIGDDIPDRHKIGIMLGSGKYFIDIKYTKDEAARIKKRKRIVFRLGERYDQLKAEADRRAREQQTTAAIVPQLPISQGNAPAELLHVVKEFLAIILPAIIKQQQPAQLPPPPPAQDAKDLLSSYAMMRQILESNLFETAETYKRFQRQFTETIQDPQTIETEIDQQQEEEKGGFMQGIQKIISMIEPFFGLLAEKSIAAKTAAMTLKAAPQFMEVLQDKNLCRQIINHFDKTHGRAAADIALKNIGIPRQIFQDTPQGHAEQSTATRTAQGPAQALPRGSRAFRTDQGPAQTLSRGSRAFRTDQGQAQASPRASGAPRTAQGQAQASPRETGAPRTAQRPAQGHAGRSTATRTAQGPAQSSPG